MIRAKSVNKIKGCSPSFKEYFFGIRTKVTIENVIKPKLQSKLFSSLNSSDNIIYISRLWVINHSVFQLNLDIH